MTEPVDDCRFHGVWDSQLTHDWRLRLPRWWGPLFGARPVIITLADDAPAWRLHPEPPSWSNFLVGNMVVWDLTQMKSRDRICIPSAIYEKAKIKNGSRVAIVGQCDYLEIWGLRD